MVESAIGLVETRGHAGLVHATDAMNKAGRVDFLRQEHIGSGFVTTMVTGAVGAVRAAVDAGAMAAKETGELLVAHVIPRLHPVVREVCLDWKLPEPDIPPYEALGMVETVGYVGLIEAADAGIKAADISITNYFTIGGGLAMVAFRGSTAEVQAAVSAAGTAAKEIATVKTVHTIPSPHPHLFGTFKLGSPAADDPGPGEGGRSLGFIECKGLAALIEGTDAGLKAAGVSLIDWKKIGGSFVTSLFQGDVSAIRAATDAGAAAAKKVGELRAVNVIPSAVEELFPAGASRN
jgi:microcompartment protein CcmL/EutN